ncbi:TetR/AcrR family transcriptional regulator C-terminal domain-containing protein [Gallaecimonas sp. GXIMD4217]|uniref:TetR/AcrR family transcriptional regulator C-terminal domain-containing protein n=1 Tax=Gallaecimonas sp. GXIMD4217 TaxID=3131927 RepID=UPI00311ABFD1
MASILQLPHALRRSATLNGQTWPLHGHSFGAMHFVYCALRGLVDATDDGKLNVGDPELAAEAFWSMFSGTFFWPPIVRGPVPKKQGQKLKAEFIEIFLAKYRIA